MVSLTAKTKDRFIKGIKKFQPILEKAKKADINESDTVTIITDMLSEVYGFDKYTNITSEFAIRGTYCDLAIKIGNDVSLLIECKAIGSDLKDAYVKQATDYAANEGIDWVVLTNGIEWKVFKMTFGKPVGRTLVYEFNFLALSNRSQADLDMLYYLSVESISKKNVGLYELHSQKEIVNRFTIGCILLDEPVVAVVKRELKKLASGLKLTDDDVRQILANEVLKREVVEGDECCLAKKKLTAQKRAAAKATAKPKDELKEVATE